MKIGILGGTFDPIHRGHSYVARAVSKILSLDRVLFVVSYYPPHKEKREITSPFHRYAMTVLDLINDKILYPSRWELDHKKLSFTIETLQYFTSHHPEHEYCFIAGSDSLKEIHLWKDCGTLLGKHCFLFVQRPGTEVDLEELKIPPSLRQNIQVLCESGKPSIRPGQSFLITLNAPPISSTSIRKIIASGRWPSSEMISPSVLQYIKKHRLYEENQDCSEEGLSGH
ncbi:nicotinate-nucleotide adenylyltransferase [Acidobacteria bacterium AH-259-G07]|nr:nicotinate-nucleotide adenylyltransferase [Acidobacteria bacterium AH-259-G07]